ncbi:MAG: phosphoribosylanthranilate isomerase, partial [Alphaproteobacteria bacterium]
AVEPPLPGGKSHIGFVFYPRSPRAVSPTQARALIGAAQTTVTTVGLFVNANDHDIKTVLTDAPLNMLQLHGAETPERVAAIKDRFGLPVMKVIPVAEANDVDRAEMYLETADWLLFDAKPPATMKNALPGGNAIRFDWSLMAARQWPLPWMLAGGITADNVAQAITQSGANAVDVSSGVEDAPGVKNPAKITKFLATVAAL